MPKYETMLIVSAALDEETGASVVQKFKSLIETNGTIDAVEEWGKRRLAFPINKEEVGVYTLIHFSSEPEFPAELDRVYKITDGVLRSLIIVKDEAMEAARLAAVERAKAEKEQAEKEQAARAAARAAAEAKAKAEAEAVAETEPAAEKELDASQDVSGANQPAEGLSEGAAQQTEE